LLNIGIRKYAAVEHFVAFAVLGALFCCAYPKRVWMICFIVFGSAIALELFQTMTPDRHGTVVDALQKISGGAFGIFAAKATLNSGHQRKRRQKVRAPRDRRVPAASHHKR
jgi:VanZ family protein